MDGGPLSLLQMDSILFNLKMEQNIKYGKLKAVFCFVLFFVFVFCVSRQLQAKAATVYMVNKGIRTMEMKDSASCSSAVKGMLNNECISSAPQNICYLFSCSSYFHLYSTRYSDVGYLYVNKSRLSVQHNLFSISGAKQWNCLRPDLCQLRKKSFLKQNLPIFICSAWWWGWLCWGLKVNIKNY